MANRYPIIVDTTNGNQFRELPEGDNLLLTGSSIVNALNISAIGTVEAQRIVIQQTNYSKYNFRTWNIRWLKWTSFNNKRFWNN